MKSVLVALVLACVSMPVVRTAVAEPVKVSDTEAVALIKTIEGYVETRNNRLEIFDRSKGEVVRLGVVRAILDNPDCVVFLDESLIAVCAECVQRSAEDKGTAKAKSTDKGDKYVVWFVLKRGGIATSRVMDTYIKSVNGKEMYTWTQNAEGKWEATLLKDGAPVVTAAPAEAAPAEAAPQPAAGSATEAVK